MLEGGKIDYFYGSFRANKPHGLGEMVYQSGEMYKGGWKNGIREGYGVLRLKNGLICKGMWSNDMMNGD